LWQVRWTELDEIVAFKVDAMTVDHVCLGFRERGTTVFHVTDEDTPGWAELREALEARFALDVENWFSRVASSAFAENRTVLWRAG
jgi:hypothetical protein